MAVPTAARTLGVFATAVSAQVTERLALSAPSDWGHKGSNQELFGSQHNGLWELLLPERNPERAAWGTICQVEPGDSIYPEPLGAQAPMNLIFHPRAHGDPSDYPDHNGLRAACINLDTPRQFP